MYLLEQYALINIAMQRYGALINIAIRRYGALINIATRLYEHCTYQK